MTVWSLTSANHCLTLAADACQAVACSDKAPISHRVSTSRSIYFRAARQSMGQCFRPARPLSVTSGISTRAWLTRANSLRYREAKMRGTHFLRRPEGGVFMLRKLRCETSRWIVLGFIVMLVVIVRLRSSMLVNCRTPPFRSAWRRWILLHKRRCACTAMERELRCLRSVIERGRL